MAAKSDPTPPPKRTPKRVFSALDALLPLAFVTALASFAAAVVWQATINCHDESSGCHTTVFNLGSAIAFFGPIIAAVVAAVLTLDAAASGRDRARWHLYGIAWVVVAGVVGMFIAIAASG